MKLTLWILNKHILCFNLTIILIVYQNLKQHVTKKITGGIHRKKLYKYPSLSVFPVMDFSIFAISPFTWNTKHVCYHLQNFIKNQFQIEKKLKTLQIDYYSCVGKFCEVHMSLFIANSTWRKLPVASPQLSLVYHFQIIYILIIKKVAVMKFISSNLWNKVIAIKNWFTVMLNYGKKEEY